MQDHRYVFYRSSGDYQFTPEFYAWRNMKCRCYTESACQYRDYGGRGIEVCDKWKNDFEAFYKDMGEKPSIKHTLDCKDVNGDYSPENCRWAEYGVQNHNQRIRVTNKSGYRGVSFSKQKKKWVVTIWQNYYMYCIGFFSDKESAALAYDSAAIQLYGDDAQLNLLGVS